MRRHNRENTQAEINLTPMLDVVFILLIFFIVTAVFIREEALQLEPTPKGEGVTAPAIIIALDEDGLIHVNGRLSAVTAVRANLERLRAETPDSGVVIQAHPKARSGDIFQIRDQAAGARVDKVNLVLSDV